MKKLIAVMLLCASSVMAQSPVVFKQGSLLVITNNAASTNGIQLQAEMVDAQQPGVSQRITLMRESVSVSPYRIVGVQFSGPKDTNFWTETTATGGSVVQTNGFISINMTTQATAYARYQSMRTARYISGESMNFRAQARLCDLGNTNNIRSMGVSDQAEANGMAFQLSGTTFVLRTCYTNVSTIITNGTFNGNIGTSIAMTTNIGAYEISWNNKSVEWFVDGSLLHKQTFPVVPATAQMNLGICLQSTNVLAVTNADWNGSFELRVASIQRFGNESTTPIWRNISGATSNTFKFSAGHLHSILIGTGGTLCNIYDGYSPTMSLILSVDTSKTTGTLGPFNIDAPFQNGLTIVTTGAGTSICVIYE
jgi:hypothetical protein